MIDVPAMTAEPEGPDHVRFTVAIDWVRGQDPDIVVRRAGSDQNDRAAIAYVLRMAARLVEEADDTWIEQLQ